MATIFLGLGSNLGERLDHIKSSHMALQKHISITQYSTIIETNPAYVLEQPLFLNQVIKGDTTLSPFELYTKIKEIEKQIGRVVTYINGPRVIDIDLLYYDQEIIQTSELIIPHPRINERIFVLAPLFEIAPNWHCPVCKKRVADLFKELSVKESCT